MFGDHAGVEAGAAGEDGGAVDRRQVESHLRQRDGLFERADVGGERLRDDGRLLENLLLHEVAVIALLDRRGGHARGRNFALDRVVVGVENLRAFAADRSEEHTSELQSLMRTSYADFRLNKKTTHSI